MLKFFNRVGFFTSTEGQGTISIGAALSPSMLTPAEAGAEEGDEVGYVIQEGEDVEIGKGTVGSESGTVIRDEVEISKIGGVVGTAKMSLSGAAVVRFAATAAAYSSFKDGATLKADIENQGPLTGGASVTPKNHGNIGTGTITINVSDRPMQRYTNSGSHTLAVDTNTAGACVLLIANTSGAGSINVAAFDEVDGDSFDTTNGSLFRCIIERWGPGEAYLFSRKIA